jgi:GNAT superfamily N-acetyltransferase
MLAVRAESIAQLDRHGQIPIEFEVRTILDVELVDGGLGGVRLEEVTVEDPWVKDHDTADGGPGHWPARFDVSSWGLLGAYEDDRRVGGAVIAFDSPEVHMLRGRRDLAVLWDLRVAPDRRRSGAGEALFQAAKTWARERGCRALEVETQQINVPACRFYRRMGCSLAAVDRFAYADLPDEAQLIWHLDLDTHRGPA